MSNAQHTLEDVRRAADEVLAEFGQEARYENVYTDLTGKEYLKKEGCVYAYDGKPMCFVAQIVTRLGVPLEDLTETDWSSQVYAVYKQFTDQANRWLGAAQESQDNDNEWGYAVRDADRNETELVGEDEDAY